MSRVETFGLATLYLGDCREILPTLTRPSCVLTDIPYETAWVDNGLRDVRYGDWQSTSAGVDFLAHVQEVPTVLCWCGWEQLTALRDGLPGRTVRLMGWKKVAPSPMNGQYYFTAGFEVGFYAKLPGAWYRGDVKPSIWEGPSPRGEDRVHPTQKPTQLMAWCLESIMPQEGTCCDPLMGSGSTGVAAVQMGRSFVGIEADPAFFDIACKRIEDAQRQLSMFLGEAA